MDLRSYSKFRLGPDLALLGIALMWGLSLPLIRVSVREMDPFTFVAYRFGIAFLAFVPFVLASANFRARIRDAFWPGIFLGLVASGIFLPQTIGLQTIPSPRAAFITGLYVVMVPLLSPLCRAGRASRRDWVSAVVALVGLFLLINPSAEPLSIGDLWIFVCALFVALHIHTMQKVKGGDPIALAFLQICVVAATAVAAAPASVISPVIYSTAAWFGLLVCALLVTNGALWIQATYQKRSTPQRTAVIFALEPVFACFFGYLMLGEGLTLRGLLGAVILTFALMRPRSLSRASIKEAMHLARIRMYLAGRNFRKKIPAST